MKCSHPCCPVILVSFVFLLKGLRMFTAIQQWEPSEYKHWQYEPAWVPTAMVRSSPMTAEKRMLAVG